MNWINIKDKLPEMYQRVFVQTTYFDDPLIVHRFDIGHGKWKWDFSKYYGLYDCPITHWMPIPAKAK